MGMLSKLFRTEPVEPVLGPSEQAALICLKLSDDEIGSSQEREAISALRDRLIRAVQECEAGEFDTLEFDNGFGTLSFIGPSADGLAHAVLPVVRTFAPSPSSYIVKRYGEPGSREQSIVLGAHA